MPPRQGKGFNKVCVCNSQENPLLMPGPCYGQVQEAVTLLIPTGQKVLHLKCAANSCNAKHFFCQIGWGPNGFLTQKADLTTTRSSPKKVSLAQTGLEVWPAVGPSERCQLPASPLPAHSKQDLKASVIYAENLAKNLHLFKNALMA